MTNKFIGAFFLISFQIHHYGAFEIINNTNSFYIAGVAEFAPKMYDASNATEALADNLKGFIELMHSTAAAATDIIVFPESSLNNMYHLTFVPDPNKKLVLCNDVNNKNYERFLIELSCHARNVSKYIVFNLYEKSICKIDNATNGRPCAVNGLNQYNTNVVFDRNGAIISRYRKVHLYGEQWNTTSVPEISWFDTDFNVRFGQLICFDILFYTPGQQLVDNLNIQNIIFSSMWFSQLPFLTAVQFQSAWSYGNDVNLLASGASYPPMGSTGTGIYLGRDGPAVMVMNQNKEGERKLYVARVLKQRINNRRKNLLLDALTSPSLSAKTINKPIATNYSYLRLKRDAIENYKSELINITAGNSLKKELCYVDEFCCKFELHWKTFEVSNDYNYYLYRIGVLDDYRAETAPETNFLKHCAVFSCVSEDIYDCGIALPTNGKEFRPQLAFTRILIEAEFPLYTQYVLMPNTLKTDLLVLEHNRFEWNVTKNKCSDSVRFLSNTTIDDLLVFSIYGNYYDGTAICNGVAGILNLGFNSLELMTFVAIAIAITKI